MYLLQFDFTLKHVPEKSMEKANGLSWKPDWQKKMKNNNKNQILIKLRWLKKTKTLVKENNMRRNKDSKDLEKE